MNHLATLVAAIFIVQYCFQSKQHMMSDDDINTAGHTDSTLLFNIHCSLQRTVKHQVIQTGRAERQMKPTVEIKLDTANVRLHLQRRNRMFYVCVPQFH